MVRVAAIWLVPGRTPEGISSSGGCRCRDRQRAQRRDDHDAHRPRERRTTDSRPFDLAARSHLVDADDRVAFFSEGPDRIFARSKAIIGRKVQHCHPPRSADTVNKILDDFRSGRQSVAEFWINFQNKFVHIRYFAVRNDEGKYLGTIELTQDLAPFRKLSGERRL